MIELAHGTTSFGHPAASAAAIATLDIYAREHLFARAHALEAGFAARAHALHDARHVVDIRNLSLVAGIELASRDGAPAGSRATEVFVRCFEAGLLVRCTGETIAISPPLVVETGQIDYIFATLRRVLGEVA